MRFEHPLILWVLLIIPPAMVVFFWWSMRQRQLLLAKFIQGRLLPGLLSGVSPRRRQLRASLLITAVSLLIVALARPQWGFTWEEVRQRGLDIVAAIDTSKSMLAEDISPNRLQRAKLAALDLMQAARTDRLGLVAFAGVAFLQCPLTIDDGAFRQSLNALDVNIMPQGGTALAEAIREAITAFKEDNNYKVLVLFTDGEDHDSGAVEAARQAAGKGLRIFTVGIGSPEGEVLRIRDASGRTDYVRDEQGNAVKSRLNEKLLQDIAAAAQGFYLPLEGAHTIETLYAKGLAPLPRSEGREKLVKRYHERYHWPLAAALLLLLAEILTPERARDRRERKPVVTPGKAAALLLASLALAPFASLASPSSALREYNSGNYDAALQEFQALQKKQADPRLNFNAGTAAYRDGQLEEAARQFGQALAGQDLQLQEKAYFNRGNTQYYLGEAAPEPQQKTKAWEQAMKDFESSLKLNPQASDAKFNHEFVKKRLEELKQQQQNQSNDKQDQQQKNQDQKSQNNSQQQQQQQQDQKQQSEKEQQASQPQQSQDQRQQQQPKPSEDQQQAQQSPAPQPGEKPPEQKNQQEAATAKESEEESPEEKAQAQAEGKMTKEEARRLLDAQKSDEHLLPMPVEKKSESSKGPTRDW